MGEGAKAVSEGRFWHRWRRLAVVLLAAAALGVGAAVPALAADESREPLVVGGTEIPNGKYPFMVSLQYNRAGTAALEDHFCGGTLIDSRHVMTAAHCVDPVNGVEGLGSGPIPASRLRIAVGATVLNSSQGQARGITGPSAISVHPRYSPGNSSAYDVAVIRLNRAVSGARPIALDAANSQTFENPGRLVRVAGWGTTREGGTVVNRMREASPPIVSDAAARRAYGEDYVPSLMVAAGREGVDTCQGDSGGPLFVRASSGYRQIGVTSFGYGCARANFPGVYTEISSPAIRSFVRQAQAN